MPYNKEQYEIAKELNRRQSDRLWQYADSPEGDRHPDYQRTKKYHDITTNVIRSYEEAGRKVDEAGKVLESPAAPEGTPSTSGFDYFFEPSVEEVKHLLQSDPSLRKRLGIDERFMTGVAVAAQSKPKYEETMGVQVGETLEPALSHLDVMSSVSPEYKLVADHLYSQAAQDAVFGGKNLQRYKDVPLRGQTVDFLAGGAENLAKRYGAPALLNATNSMTMGVAGPLGDYITDKIGESGLMDTSKQPRAAEVLRRSPGAALLGGIAGYAASGNPTNLLQEGIYKQGVKALGDTVGKRIGAAAIAGGASNMIEGAVRDTAEGLADGDSGARIAGNVTGNMPLNFGMGSVIGGTFHGGSEIAGRVRRGFREQEHLMMPMKVFREGGGDTSIPYGVEETPAMRRYMDASQKDGAVGSPEALAADDVAPKIQESLERQDREATDKIGAQMERYYAHPEYGQLRVSSKPLVQALVDMVSEGRFRTEVGQEAAHMDPDMLRTIRREVAETKWAEARYADPQTARQIAEDVDGIVIDLDTANDIFGVPEDVSANQVAVVIPKRMSAKELTRFEEKIYEKTKPGPEGNRAPSPVYTRLDAAAKEVRDRFPAWEDEAGNFVSPPDGMPNSIAPSMRNSARPSRAPVASPPAGTGGGLPSGPQQLKSNSLKPPPVDPGSVDVPVTNPRDEGPSTAIDLSESQYDEVGPSVMNGPDNLPSTRQHLSSSEIDPQPGTDPMMLRRLEGHDVTSSGYMGREELGSGDFLATGGELDSNDFGKQTPRRKGLQGDVIRKPKQKAPDDGPQKGDFGSYNEWALARADWRLRQGKATEGDIKRLAKHTDEMPNTQKNPSDEAPNTRRSVAPPPDDESPLSVLAGNKLAMKIEEPSIDKSMGDVTPSQYGEADEVIKNIEGRLGEFEPEARMTSILGVLSKKLGREVTKEDLIRAGVITAGVAAALSSDDENVQGLGAMVAGAGGGKGKFPRELEAKLTNGETVKGFSALRNQQHNLKTGIETAKTKVGASNNKTIKDRVVDFNLTKNNEYDKALLAEAEKLGVADELRLAAAVRVLPELKRYAAGGSNKGTLEGVVNALGLRSDKILEVLSGTPKNPFYKGPETLLGSSSRRLFDLSGGRVGSRFGDNFVDLYESALESPDERRKREKNASQR